LIGRYVVMPDHVHFFCAEPFGGARHSLSRSISPPIWQAQFFDHILRTSDSYGEKWAYVRENPVRKGLAISWEQWPYQGFVDFDIPGSM